MEWNVDWSVEKINEMSIDSALQSSFQENYLIENIKLLYHKLYNSAKEENQIFELKTILKLAKTNDLLKSFLSLNNLEDIANLETAIVLANISPQLCQLGSDILTKSIQINNGNLSPKLVINATELVNFLDLVRITLPKDLDLSHILAESLENVTLSTTNDINNESIHPEKFLFNIQSYSVTNKVKLSKFSRELKSRFDLGDNLEILYENNNAKIVLETKNHSQESKALSNELDEMIRNFKLYNFDHPEYANLAINIWLSKDFPNTDYKPSYYQSIVENYLKNFYKLEEDLEMYFGDFFNSDEENIKSKIFDLNYDISSLIKTNKTYSIAKLVQNIYSVHDYHDKFINRLTDPVTLEKIFDDLLKIDLIVELETEDFLTDESGQIRYTISDIRKVNRDSILNINDIKLYRMLILKLYSNGDFINLTSKLFQAPHIRYQANHTSKKIKLFQNIIRDKIINIFHEKLNILKPVHKKESTKNSNSIQWAENEDEDYSNWVNEIKLTYPDLNIINYDSSDLKDSLHDFNLNSKKVSFLVWILERFSVEMLLSGKNDVFKAIAQHYRFTKINRQGEHGKNINVYEISPISKNDNRRILVLYSNNKIVTKNIAHHDHGINAKAGNLIKNAMV
jgi:hypothetical protein